MKILFYRYNSIIEPDILMAFQALGIETTEYGREMTEKEESLPDLVRSFGRFLYDHPADLVFSINFFPHVSEVCERFHIRYVSWTVDSPVMELYTRSISNSYNRTFLFDRAQYRAIRPFHPEGVFYQPLAARTGPKDDLFRRTGAGTRGKYRADVAFVGSLYTEKSPYRKVHDLPPRTAGYLDGIMQAQETVYGYYFIEDLLDDETVHIFKAHHPSFYQLPPGSYLTDKRTLSELYIGNEITARERTDLFKDLGKTWDGKADVSLWTGSDTKGLAGIRDRGFAKSLTEMPLIFHEARICLNTTSKPIQTGLPLRIFDILSSGGFCLTNYQAEIPDLFTPGEDLVLYSSFEEMEEEISYYLSHEKERREIAEAGRRKVEEAYSMEKVVGKILLTALEH